MFVRRTQRHFCSFFCKGQSVMETSILILVIVAALIAMQVYLKRGIQGRLRANVENIGEQYDPQATTSDFTLTHISNETTITNTAVKNVILNSCVGPYCGSTVDTVSITTSKIETHYDNTIKNGYENILAP